MQPTADACTMQACLTHTFGVEVCHCCCWAMQNEHRSHHTGLSTHSPFYLSHLQNKGLQLTKCCIWVAIQNALPWGWYQGIPLHITSAHDQCHALDVILAIMPCHNTVGSSSAYPWQLEDVDMFPAHPIAPHGAFRWAGKGRGAYMGHQRRLGIRLYEIANKWVNKVIVWGQMPSSEKQAGKYLSKVSIHVVQSNNERDDVPGDGKRK